MGRGGVPHHGLQSVNEEPFVPELACVLQSLFPDCAGSVAVAGEGHRPSQAGECPHIPGVVRAGGHVIERAGKQSPGERMGECDSPPCQLLGIHQPEPRGGVERRKRPAGVAAAGGDQDPHGSAVAQHCRGLEDFAFARRQNDRERLCGACTAAGTARNAASRG